jgi:hypothetical protein
MAHYTTAGGSTVTINGHLLVITTKAGKVIKLTAVKTTAIPSDMKMPAGLDRTQYRLCCGQPVDLATAAWIDANIPSLQLDPSLAAADATRRINERNYDNLYNEGCDGYNPYRANVIAAQ